jgi:hypothetical protein
MSLNRVANVLDTDTALFRNSAIAFRCMAIGRYRCRGRAGGRGAGILGATPSFARMAHFDQLQLAPKLGRHRLKSNPLCLASHRRCKTFGAFDLAAQGIGVRHLIAP